MKTKFQLILEQVILESIASDIDALDIPDDIKEEIKALQDDNGKPNITAQKAALFWVKRGLFILPKEKVVFFKALSLVGFTIKNFQELKTREAVNDAIDSSKKFLDERKAKADAKKFDLKKTALFSHEFNAGDGVLIYDVDDSKKGQEATRKAIDQAWGITKNPWCLTQTDGGVLSEGSWEMWKHYDAYKKRAAFKDGKIIGFSANSNFNLGWWDLNDAFTQAIPYSNDYEEEIMERGYYHEEEELSDEELEEVLESNPYHALNAYDDRKFEEEVYKMNKILNEVETTNDPDVLRKHSTSSSLLIKAQIAKNPSAPIDVLRAFSIDKDAGLRQAVASNKNTPGDVLVKLVDDQDKLVKYALVDQLKNSREDLPIEFVVKLIDKGLVDAWFSFRRFNPNFDKFCQTYLKHDEVKNAIHRLTLKNKNDIMKTEGPVSFFHNFILGNFKGQYNLPEEDVQFYVNEYLSILSTKTGNYSVVEFALRKICFDCLNCGRPTLREIENALLKYNIPVGQLYFSNTDIRNVIEELAKTSSSDELLDRLKNIPDLKEKLKKNPNFKGYK